jgi:hypothetical protein
MSNPKAGLLARSIMMVYSSLETKRTLEFILLEKKKKIAVYDTDQTRPHYYAEPNPAI